MPDISMCLGTGCPKKDECYRYTAKPTPHWQSYFCKPPIKDGECEYFWDNNLQEVESVDKDNTMHPKGG